MSRIQMNKADMHKAVSYLSSTYFSVYQPVYSPKNYYILAKKIEFFLQKRHFCLLFGRPGTSSKNQVFSTFPKKVSINFRPIFDGSANSDVPV